MKKENQRTRGRPSGSSDIRGTILRIARSQFSNQGYDHTTMRSVATEAAVNPALIAHYFSSKRRLFLEAVLLASPMPTIFNHLLKDASTEIVGVRLAKLTCILMEDADSRATFLGLLRAATSDAEIAKILQTFISTNLQSQLRQCLPEGDTALTATLLSSQIIGLFVTRYITKIEPMASISLSEFEPKLAIHFQKQIG